jgi:hypothetical protein
MSAVDYVVFPEYTMVRSNVVIGSMAGSHLPRLVALHAVARDDDGTLHGLTMCEKLRVHFGQDDGEPVRWDQVNFNLKCPDCMAKVGDAPRGPDGRQHYPQRRF